MDKIHKLLQENLAGFLSTENLNAAIKEHEGKFNAVQELIKRRKKSGFFTLEPAEKRKYCLGNNHFPPMNIYIPQGMGYRHVCPDCGEVTEIIPPQITL